jgi:PadR family transcriptional regulator, regulatory protein PadR
MNVTNGFHRVELTSRRARVLPQNRIVRSFFHGMLRLFILREAAPEPVYGGALAKRLRRLGYEISPGSLYPLLHSLERERLVRHRSRLVGGRERKYYELTAFGRSVLETVRTELAGWIGAFLSEDSRSSTPQ